MPGGVCRPRSEAPFITVLLNNSVQYMPVHACMEWVPACAQKATLSPTKTQGRLIAAARRCGTRKKKGSYSNALIFDIIIVDIRSLYLVHRDVVPSRGPESGSWWR